MAQKKKVMATVMEQKELAPGIFDMWLKTELASDAKCGQFIGVYPEDKSNLLPRPISICEVNKEEGMLRIVYRVAGEGTEEFSHYEVGKEVPILGILGNGFPIEEGKGKKAFLMGGGIGVPPIVQLAKELDADKQAIIGYRDNNLFLKEDLENYAKGYIATALRDYMGTEPNKYVVTMLSLRSNTWESFDFSGYDSAVCVAAIVHRKDDTTFEQYVKINCDMPFLYCPHRQKPLFL